MTLNRYSYITEKNPREIILLRGSGCHWRRCRFCTYHHDHSTDESSNIKLNQAILAQVKGISGVLEVINSGSINDLPAATLDDIFQTIKQKSIYRLHVEAHWQDRLALPPLRQRAESAGIELKVKSGIETFNGLVRESYLDKGIPAHITAQEIAEHFDECCLLFGLPGQHLKQMISDLSIGLTYFERICVNIFCDNESAIRRDAEVVRLFSQHLYPLLKDHPRVDVLMENTDFGVG